MLGQLHGISFCPCWVVRWQIKNLPQHWEEMPGVNGDAVRLILAPLVNCKLLHDATKGSHAPDTGVIPAGRSKGALRKEETVPQRTSFPTEGKLCPTSQRVQSVRP